MMMRLMRVAGVAFAAGVLMLAGCDRVLPPTQQAEQAPADGPGVRLVTARGALADSEQATVQLFEMSAPSVVQVVTRGPVSNSMDLGEIGAGTGFVWDEAGHIVTNNHVVDAPDIVVRLPTGEIVRATVVGRAPQYDVAVLRPARPLGARALPIGSSNDLRVGQAVFAIGNPFGLDQSLSSGIVSALQRRLPTPDGREIADVIQTDAAINPGNSGGPLLDSAGRVIGITTAIYSPSGAYAGVGFAVPIDTIARVVPELIANGRAPTPGIGILAANESASAKIGVDGVVIYRVLPGGPAARAGLQGASAQGALGDVIVAANGEPVRRLADLTNLLERIGVGADVTLTVQRGQEQVEVAVAVEDIGER